MRVIREFHQGDIRISIFNWNNKYLVKLERGRMEQTFKVPEYDIAGEDKLVELIGQEFIGKCLIRFNQMEEDWKNALDTL